MSNIAGMITTNFYLVCEELRIDFSPPNQVTFLEDLKRKMKTEDIL